MLKRVITNTLNYATTFSPSWWSPRVSTFSHTNIWWSLQKGKHNKETNTKKKKG